MCIIIYNNIKLVMVPTCTFPELIPKSKYWNFVQEVSYTPLLYGIPISPRTLHFWKMSEGLVLPISIMLWPVYVTMSYTKYLPISWSACRKVYSSRAVYCSIQLPLYTVHKLLLSKNCYSLEVFTSRSGDLELYILPHLKMQSYTTYSTIISVYQPYI